MNSWILGGMDYYPFGMEMPGRSFTAETGYRYGFNGQEKVDEICGDGNHNTALFWEYDTRLGRRWNLDPKPNPWESQYSVLGDNPITIIDLLGDKWKTSSDDNKAKDLNNKLEIRKNHLNKSAEKLSAKANMKQEKGNFEKAETLRARAEEAKSNGTELAIAQTEIKEISNSETEFTFKENKFNNISYTSMSKDGTIVIEFSSDENAIHELTHAYQQLNGDIKLIAGTGGGYNIDLIDEQKAYRRQYAFSPFSVSSLNSAPSLTIKTSKDISTDFVKNIWTTDKTGARVYPYTGHNTNEQFEGSNWYNRNLQKYSK